jgi:mannitol/fructose-specific phosphotransferase system IIA component
VSTPVDPPLVRVLDRRAYATKRAVIESIGEALLTLSAVTPAYVSGMLRKEDEANTMVTSEVALPHGTADVRGEVLRNAIVVVPIPDGVEWAPGQRVRLAIGFAGKGDTAHLRLMSSVARVLADDVLLAHLKNARDVHSVAALFETGS